RAAGALRSSDAGEQHLPGIRAAHPAGRLVAVERDGVGAEISGPEACLEPLGEPLRLRLERERAFALADARGAQGERPLRRIDVALHFGERDRSFREPAVGMEYVIEGILPALVREPFIRGAVILNEAVAVLIGGAVDPGQRGFEVGPDRADGLVIAGSL